MAFLRLVCAFLHLAALIAAMEPARVHEARQGPISTIPLSSSTHSASAQTSLTAKTTIIMPATSTSISSQSSSATPQPSSSPASLNITAQNMTTCTSGLISWKYSGEQAELFLSITNIGVDQDDYILSRIKARQNDANTTIQQQLVDTDTSAQNWTWPTVNLTQGWYKIQGLALATQNVSSDSAPFFIANGTSVSCLIGTSPQASSTASPSASTSSTSAVSKSDVGSIVGGVVGAVVGVFLAIAAGVYLWLRKRKRPFVGDAVNRNRKWGSLKSTNSSIQPVAQHTNDHFHSRTDSTAAALGDVASGDASTTPSRSDEDVAGTAEEKLASPASSYGMSPSDALNTPVHYDRRSSMYHVPSPTTTLSDDSRSRTVSLRASNRTLEQQAQRIRSSMETSMQRRTERLSMPTLPSAGLTRHPHSPTTHAHTASREEYALSHMTTMPINRSISSGGMSTTGARRTPRKPVPRYDSSLLQEDVNADSASTFTGGAESSHSHGTGTLPTPTDLVNNPGFGDGRPVHYLIPDMPPPPQD